MCWTCSRTRRLVIDREKFVFGLNPPRIILNVLKSFLSKRIQLKTQEDTMFQIIPLQSKHNGENYSWVWLVDLWTLRFRDLVIIAKRMFQALFSTLTLNLQLECDCILFFIYNYCTCNQQSSWMACTHSTGGTVVFPWHQSSGWEVSVDLMVNF